jgi:hypothetical protein
MKIAQESQSLILTDVIDDAVYLVVLALTIDPPSVCQYNRNT